MHRLFLFFLTLFIIHFKKASFALVSLITILLPGSLVLSHSLGPTFPVCLKRNRKNIIKKNSKIMPEEHDKKLAMQS